MYKCGIGVADFTQENYEGWWYRTSFFLENLAFNLDFTHTIFWGDFALLTSWVPFIPFVGGFLYLLINTPLVLV